MEYWFKLMPTYMAEANEERKRLLDDNIELLTGMLDLKKEKEMLGNMSYSKMHELIELLNMCESNDVVEGMKYRLERNTHIKEDDMFMGLYSASQNGDLNSFLDNLSDEDKLIAQRAYESIKEEDYEHDINLVNIRDNMRVR